MIWPFRSSLRKPEPAPQVWEIECPECGAFHDFQDPAFDRLVEMACVSTDRKMSKLGKKLGIGAGQDILQIDSATDSLEFTLPDGDVLACPIDYIGSWFRPRSEFFWAWANTNLEPGMRRAGDTTKSKAVGDHLAPLRSERVTVSLHDAWHLAKVGTELSDSTGVCLVPASDDLVFFSALNDLKRRRLH